MPKLKSLLKRPLLSLLLLFLLMEFLPVFGKNATALCLYESHNFKGDYTTYYILQPDGDLISWGKGPLDHNYETEHSNVYLYFLRKKIARRVTSFACTPNVILYVDGNHVLWGSGTDKELLHSENERANTDNRKRKTGRGKCLLRRGAENRRKCLGLAWP